MAWIYSKERIKLAREASGVTQTELAEKMGISRQQLNQLENDKDGLGVKTLVKICNALGCPPKFFFVQTVE